jgi:plasmid maintenance system antidote protein VapI
MKANTEKFDALVSNKTSGWHKDVNERITNKAWQDKAFDIALKVIRHMRTNKVSQVTLAKDMGVTPQYINKILQGKENMTLETICRIEDALGIKLIEVVYSSSETYELEVTNSIFSNLFSAKSVVKESIEWDSIGYQQNVA